MCTIYSVKKKLKKGTTVCDLMCDETLGGAFTTGMPTATAGNHAGGMAAREETLGGGHAKLPRLYRGVEEDRFVVPRVRAA